MNRISFIVLTLLILIVPFQISKKAQENFNLKVNLSFFRLNCLFFTAWIFCTLFLYMIPDLRWATYFHHLKYAFISLMAVFFFLHVYVVLRNSAPSGKVILALCIVPIITFVLSVTQPLHHLIYTRNAADMIDGITPSVTFGPWFYVHMIYTYLLLFFTFVITLKPIYMLPDKSKKPLKLLLLGGAIVVIANFIHVFDIITVPYDITLPATAIALIVFYYSLSVTVSANIIITSRDKIYNNLQNMVFILDLEGKIIDYNKQAEEHFSTIITPPYDDLPFDEFVKRWFWTRNGRMSPYKKNIYITEKDNKESHYLLYDKDVIENGQHIGYFIEMLEISEVYNVFRLLEESAFYDNLTGLNNRNSYIIKVSEWEGEDVLPLAIVISDVNKLKEVNDTYGHLIGDELLVNVANIINDSVPERSYVARIGGDEFVVMIPNSSQEEIETVYNIINTNLSQHRHPVYGRFSLALGGVLRKETKPNIQEMIQQADEAMYRDKHDRRKS